MRPWIVASARRKQRSAKAPMDELAESKIGLCDSSVVDPTRSVHSSSFYVHTRRSVVLSEFSRDSLITRVLCALERPPWGVPALVADVLITRFTDDQPGVFLPSVQP